MKTLKYFMIFTISIFLVGCNKQRVIDLKLQNLNCADWINDINIDFLTKSFQQKQMSSSLSNIVTPIVGGISSDLLNRASYIEEDISYELFLKEKAEKGPTSLPISDIISDGYKGSFSGFIFFKPKKSGNYHVIVSQRVWVDFIEENSRQNIPSTAYTDEKCGNDIINKVVQFPLEKGKQYIFYLVNSEKSSIKVAIKHK